MRLKILMQFSLIFIPIVLPAFLSGNHLETGVFFPNDNENCIANAGDDRKICNESSVNLNAEPAKNNQIKGTWSQSLTQDQQGVRIESPNLPNSLVTGLVPGHSYRFFWTLEGSSCPNQAFDEVIISVENRPEEWAEAGEDIFTCGQSTVLLNAQPGFQSKGKWTSSGNDLEIENQEMAQTLVHDLNPGVHSFYWSLSTEGCPDYSRDSMRVHFERPPISEDRDLQLKLNESRRINLLQFEDPDFEMENWVIEYLEEPAFGQMEMVDDLTLEYRPVENFSGFDQISWQWCSLNCPSLCTETRIRLIVNDGKECTPTNIITPNNDGFNDYFEIPCLDEFPGTEVIILSSFGEQVYRDKAYKNNWKGEYKGSELPPGTYFYLIWLHNATNTMLQGFFMIHR